MKFYPIILPILILVTIVAVAARFVVASFLLLCGIRGIDVRAALHPFKYNFDAIWHDAKYGETSWSSFFLQRKNGKMRRLWGFTMLFAPIVPATICLFTLLGGVIAWWNNLAGFSVLEHLLFGIAFYVGLIISIVVFMVSATVGAVVAALLTKILGPSLTSVFAPVGRLLATIVERIEKRMRTFVRIPKTSENKHLVAGYESLLCDGQDRPRRISEMPFSLKRTPVLLYEEIIYRFCKPFAR